MNEYLLTVVGMITVFTALIFVVLSGNGIILFVNKFLPEEQKIVQKPRTQASSSFDSKKMAAIVAAVDIATQGKGKVVSVEKA